MIPVLLGLALWIDDDTNGGKGSDRSLDETSSEFTDRQAGWNILKLWKIRPWRRAMLMRRHALGSLCVG